MSNSTRVQKQEKKERGKGGREGKGHPGVPGSLVDVLSSTLSTYQSGGAKLQQNP